MLYVLQYLLLGLLIPFTLSTKVSKIKSNINEYNFKIKWTPILVCAVVITVLIRGLAYNTGMDWLAYQNYFDKTQNGESDYWGEHTEFGYKLLIIFLTFFTSADQVFFILAAFVFIFAVIQISSILGKASFYSLLIWPIFMFTLSMNLYRQFISISFILLAVFFLLKKKKLMVVILSLLALSFHFSSIIMVIFVISGYYLQRLHLNKYLIITIILLTNVLTQYFENFIKILIDNFQIIFSIGNTQNYSSKEIFESVYEITFVKYVIMFTYIIWVWHADEMLKHNRSLRLFYFFATVSFIMYPLAQQEILSRINLYFTAFIPLFLGGLIYYYRLKRSYSIYLIYGTLFFHTIRYIYTLYMLGVEFPYKLNIFY